MLIPQDTTSYYSLIRRVILFLKIWQGKIAVQVKCVLTAFTHFIYLPKRLSNRRLINFCHSKSTPRHVSRCCREFSGVGQLESIVTFTFMADSSKFINWKLDRKNQNHFRNDNIFGWVLQDGCDFDFLCRWGDDARFVADSSESTTSSGKRETTIKQQVLKAMTVVTRRFQFGDDSNNYFEHDANSKSTFWLKLLMLKIDAEKSIDSPFPAPFTPSCPSFP